jgi:signal transduction histidine kinase
LNAAAEKQGRQPREVLLGKTMQEAYPGIEAAPFFATLREAMERRESRQLDNEFSYPDGSRGWFDLRIEPHPLGLIIFSTDITARKALEQKYLHAQKLEAVARLAGGVAHDFNNLLSVVLSYTQMVVDELNDGDDHKRDLMEVVHAGERAAALTRQLLAFSRTQVMQTKLLDLNAVVSGLARMLKALVGERVALKLELSPTPLVLKADRGLVEQVLTNLVVNARDAMPMGGEVTVSLERKGEHAELRVRDTGTGMDAKTRERIFEPFFTTKEAGKGTGLGLSTVFGIVTQMGGAVSADTTPGRGSVFKVLLPLEPEGTVVPPEPVAAPREPNAAVGSGHVVLVVDDEPQVLAVASAVLASAGFVVQRASNGPDALALAASLQALELLVTDVVMPGMTGPELATALRAKDPKLKVLFMSGYDDPEPTLQRELAGAELVEKPLVPERLLGRVRSVLAAVLH